MTIFRDEVDSRFMLLFTVLLLVKLFHLLSQDRIDYVRTTAFARTVAAFFPLMPARCHRWNKARISHVFSTFAT